MEYKERNETKKKIGLQSSMKSPSGDDGRKRTTETIIICPNQIAEREREEKETKGQQQINHPVYIYLFLQCMIGRSNINNSSLVTILGKSVRIFLPSFSSHSNINQYHPNVRTGTHMSDRKIDTLHSCAHIPSFQCRKQKQQQLTRTHTHTRVWCLHRINCLLLVSLFFICVYLTLLWSLVEKNTVQLFKT